MLTRYRLLLLVCTLLTSSLQLAAQLDITGTITDTTGIGLPYANVVLLNAEDSTLAAFSSTDKNGVFDLSTSTGAKEYLLRASYIGYVAHTRTLDVGPNDLMLKLGNIALHVQGYFLAGAEVNGYRIPIRMRGDTVVFDADAFATGPNAVVEDLFRQLPGLSIQPGGALLFHGKPVSEVMVNGRPFFRGNTQLLTQNLNASAVENVEVFDRKSAAETVSGEDDGREDLTVNLTIKPEAEGDPFGEVYAGAGTNQRFRAGGKAFRINGQNQLGAVATANNLNQTGLSYSDLSSIGQTGNLRSGSNAISPLRPNGQVLGDNTTLAGGLNTSAPFPRKPRAGAGGSGNATLSYLLYDVTEGLNATETNQYAEERLGEQVITIVQNTRSYLHHVAADYEYQRDTSAWLTLRIDGQLGGRGLDGRSAVLRVQQSDTSAYTQTDASKDRLPQLSSTLNYSQRLGSSGSRTLAVWNKISFQEERAQLASTITGLSSSSAILTDGTRNWSSEFSALSNDGRISLRQRVSENWTATAALKYTLKQTRSTAELESMESMSGQFRSAYSLLSPTVDLRRKLGEGHLTLGLGRQLLDWNLSGDFSRRVQTGYWAPLLSYMSGTKPGRLTINLTGNPEVPQPGDLFALPNPSQVSELRLGSPALLPAYRYQANGNYTLFNQFAGFSLFANARAAHIDSPVGYALDLRGEVPVSQAVNVDFAREYSGFARLGQVLGPLRMKASIEGSLTRRSGPAILNDAPTTNQAMSVTGDIKLQRSLGEDGFVALGYRVTQVRSSYNRTTQVGASTQAFSVTGEREVVNRLRVSTKFSVQHFSNLGGGPSPDRLPLWQLGLEWQAWKDKPHYLRLTAADLLNQNRGVEQQALGFLIRETQANVLGRYVVLSAHWRL